jgi:hypothetical protein
MNRVTNSFLRGALLLPRSGVLGASPVRSFAMERARDCVKIGGSIRENGAPHRVIKITQGKRGKGGGFVKAKMKVVFGVQTVDDSWLYLRIMCMVLHNIIYII